MRSGLWAALVVIAVIWIVAIGFEREPCKQVEMVAAPARLLVMWGRVLLTRIRSGLQTR
jgi:hypothetical protein